MMRSLDTNIFIYCIDAKDPRKHDAAINLLARAIDGQWPVAAQVYGEFYSVATRKGLATRAGALDMIETWQALLVPLPSSVLAHACALKLAAAKQVQYWDALIIAICAENGVKTLYSEDAPSAKKLLGVQITSPF
jgi:predicted nucleic acid-binding protein